MLYATKLLEAAINLSLSGGVPLKNCSKAYRIVQWSHLGLVSFLLKSVDVHLLSSM